MKLSRLYLLFSLLAVSNAAAGELTYNISGYADALYGYSDVSSRYEKFDKNNNQVNLGYLSSSAEYDFNEDYRGGIYLNLMGGTDKEIQNYNNGNWGKEIYASLNTPFGQFVGGETYNVATLFQLSAPSFGPLKINNSEIVDFISNPNWYRRDKKYASFKTLNSTAMNTDGVAPKISYISPEFYKTTFGFSYIPDTYNRRGLENRFADYARKDAYVAGLFNEQDFGAFQVATSLGYGIYHKNDQEFTAAMSVNRGNWTVGGGFRRTYVDGGDYAIAKENLSPRMPAWFDNYREGKAWNAGIGYQFGPYKGSLSYFEATADNTDNRDRVVMFSNDYQVNKWLNIYAIAAHVDFRGENWEVQNNNKGYAFVTGLGLNF